MAYALITGASKGIGKEMALDLAARGYDLLLIARSSSELEEVKILIQSKFGVSIYYLTIDLSLSASPKQVYDWCISNNYNVQILINNAGYACWGYFEKLGLAQQKDMMSLNMNAIVELTHLFLPQLKVKPEKTYIMNVASTAGYQAVPALSVYAASKSFVLLFTRGLRFELRKSNVSVTCLSPGPTSTNFTNRAGMQAMQAVADKFNMPANVVAKIAIKAMFQRKAEIIPGLVNVIQIRAIDLLPKSLIESIAANLYFKHLGK